MRFLIGIFCLAAMCGPTLLNAHSLPSDVVPELQKIIMFRDAERRACVALFPELTGVIDRAWKDWPPSRMKIRLLVNGKEWVDPPLRLTNEEALADMKKVSREKAKTQCERFPASLSTALEHMDYDVFIKPLLDFGNK